MAFKLDLGKFKKISSDKHSTTMRHEDGHELRVAHAALSPKLRGQLAELPKADDSKPARFEDGGKVSGRPQIADPRGYNTTTPSTPVKEYKPAHKNSTSNAPESPSDVNKVPEEEKETGEGRVSFADGGDVEGDQLAQSMGAPAPQAAASNEDSPASSAPAQDPAIANAKQIYNLKVSGMGALQGQPVDPEQAAKAAGTTGMMFGPNGEAPENFNASAWNEAQQAAQMQQQASSVNAQKQASSVVEENKARAQAGVPLLPVPQTPIGQAGAAAALAQPPQVPPPAASPGQPSDPYGTQATGEAYAKGIQEQKQGMFGEANAMAAQGHAEAQALQQRVENQQIEAKSYQDHYQSLDQERKHFIDDINNQHIDPQHYVSNMGTAQRISTGIGLILGGIGSGVTGQENAALSMLNKNIDRDIAAQAAELGKKENLLSANMKQFGNLKDATEMTRVMQNDIVSNQLRQAAAKAMDPLAKARALMAAGKLDAESAPILGQIAARKTLLGGLQNGTADPARVVNLIVPENQRAAANKELVEAQEAVKARDSLLTGLDQVRQLNTVANRTLHPIDSKAQIAAIKGPIVAALSKATAGRFTDQDSKMLDALFAGAMVGDKTFQIQRAQALRLINEKMNYPILKTYGIDPSQMGRYNDQGVSRFTHIPVSPPKSRK